jgi:hypothetical protein
MKDKVSSHEIVRRVTQSYSGSKYIEFKDVINSMLLSYQFDFWSLTATVGIHKNNLYWHQNRYETPDPKRNNQHFYKETPFISTTAGTVERDNAITTNTTNLAQKIALDFATDTWNRDGWLFYCYDFILGRKSFLNNLP